jgi:hypothetical protein
MRLVPKKVLFYLFIRYIVVTFKVHSLCLHTPFLTVLSFGERYQQMLRGVSSFYCAH